MSAAEIKARLTSSLAQINEYFTVNNNCNIDEKTQEILTTFLAQNQFIEFLNYAESTSRNDPYSKHNELILLLYPCWSNLYDNLGVERKNTIKRLKLLKEDRKADPININKLETNIKSIEDKKSIALINVCKFKLMVGA